MFNTQAHGNPAWTIGQTLIDRNDLTSRIERSEQALLLSGTGLGKGGIRPQHHGRQHAGAVQRPMVPILRRRRPLHRPGCVHAQGEYIVLAREVEHITGTMTLPLWIACPQAEQQPAAAGSAPPTLLAPRNAA